MPLKLEVRNNFFRKSSGEMRASRNFETRKNFFSNGYAADNRAAFQQQNFFSGSGKISCGHEAIVAGANHDRVVVRHGCYSNLNRVSLSISRAASRPDAAMTPPPGWVQAPQR